MAFEITLGKLGVKLVLDDGAFQRKMSEARKGLNSAARGLAKGAGMIGAAAVAGLGMAVNEWAKLEQAVMNAAAVSNMGADAFGGFLDAAIRASAGTQFSATEAGQALQYLSMAGFDAVQAVKALPGVLDLATAGNLDLARTSDITSDILTGMGMKVEELARVNDVLVKTFISSNTNLEMLGNSFKYVGPVAKSFDQDIETVAASLGLMANAGIKSDQAGRQLRMMMVRLAKPTRTTRDAMKALGTSIADKKGEFRDFIDVIRDLEDASTKMSKAKLNENIARLFGSEALPGVLALLEQGSQKLEQFRDDLRNAGGTAKEVAETMRSTLSNQLKVLQGNVQNLGAKFGQVLAPGIAVVSKRLTDLVISTLNNRRAFRQFRDQAANTTKMIGQFMQAAAQAAAVLGVIAGAAMEAVNGYRMLGKMVEWASTSLALFEAIAEEGGKGPRGTAIVRQMEGLSTEMIKIGEQTGTFLSGAMEQFDNLVALGDGTKKVFDEASEAIKETTMEEAKALASAEALKTALEEAEKGSKDTFGSMKGDADDAYKSIWKLQGILRDFNEKEEDAAVKSAEKALKQWEKVKKAREAVENVHQALFDAVKDNDTEQQKKEIERREEADQKANEERQKNHAKQIAAFRESVDNIYLNAIDGFVEMASIVAEAFSGGERSILGPAMETFASFASNAAAIVDGASRALAGDMSGAASAADAATSIVKTAASAMLRYVLSHEDLQASLTVVRGMLDQIDLDVIGRVVKAFDATLGVLLEIPIALGAFDEWSAMFGKALDIFARDTFNTAKQMAVSFLKAAIVFEQVDIIISKVALQLLGAYITMATRINEALGRVFKNFHIDVSGAEGALVEFGMTLKESSDKQAEYRAAIDNLNSLTFDQAKAAGEKAREEAKATQNLKELNNELRNAPAGFKRLAKMRFDATAAQGSMEQRGVGLTSSGSVTSTNIAQTIINHFNGMTYEEGAAVVIEQIERRNFVRTGSRSAVAAQRQTQRIRDGIRQAG